MVCDIGRAVPRWLLSTINFFILVLSLFLLFLGVLFTTIPLHMISLTKNVVSSPHLSLSITSQDTITSLLGKTFITDVGRVIIGSSVCLLLPSTLGYIGAVRESKLLLVLYFTPILLIWSLELIFLILLPAFKSSLYSTSSWVGKLSLTYYKEEKEEINLISFLWNTAMAQLECCGLDNYTDFTSSTEWQRIKLRNQILPSACCILDQTKYPQTISPQDDHCVFVPTKYNSHWMQGCIPEVTKLLADNTSLVILVIIVILTIEIVVVILSVCLCLLQKTRSDKTVHTVIVREQPSWDQDRNERAEYVNKKEQRL